MGTVPKRSMLSEALFCFNRTLADDDFLFLSIVCLFLHLAANRHLSHFSARFADMVDRVFQYAERVAGGYRQPLPASFPPEVRALISDCWQSNPITRPSAAKVPLMHPLQSRLCVGNVETSATPPFDMGSASL